MTSKQRRALIAEARALLAAGDAARARAVLAQLGIQYVLAISN